MSNQPELPKKIRYKYVMDDSVRMSTAHGVWGGINPQGEIELNFYEESDSLPQWSECLVAPDGSLGPEMMDEENLEVREVVRRINTRVLLNYNTARAVLEWLEDRVAALEFYESGMAVYPRKNTGPEQYKNLSTTAST